MSRSVLENGYRIFIRLNAAAFIEFFVIGVWRLFDGGVYLKSNSFLTEKWQLNV